MITLDLQTTQAYTWTNAPVILIPVAFYYLQIYILLKWQSTALGRLMRLTLMPLGLLAIIRVWLGYRIVGKVWIPCCSTAFIH